MNQNPQRHPVLRIVLPSGRSIEVVGYREPNPLVTRGLHVCSRCASELVQPVAWSEPRGGRWELTLECPNCGWTSEGIYDRTQIDRLEQHLDDGLNEMIRDLQRLAHAVMADQIDSFAAALWSDQILPEDF